MSLFESVFKSDDNFLSGSISTTEGNLDRKSEEEKRKIHELCGKSRQLSIPVFMLFHQLGPAMVRFLMEVKKPKRNFCFSPYSIFAVLNVIYGHIREDYRKEFDILRIGMDVDLIKTLSSSHKYFIHFHEEMLSLGLFFSSKSEFSSTFREVSTKAIKARCFNDTLPKPGTATVNEYVQFKCGGRMGFVCKKIPKKVNFLVLSTMLFEVTWEFPFDKSNSRTGYRYKYFKKERGSHKCEMMSEYDRSCMYGEHEKEGVKFSSLTLPCQEEDFSLLFIKTNEMERSEFKRLGEVVFSSKATILSDIRGEQSSRELDTIMIPKFTCDYTIDLADILKTMGIRSIFERGCLEKVLEGGADTPISQIVFKGRLVVSEKGTEMRATQGLGFGGNSIVKSEVRYQFVLDQPFYCFVIHNMTNIVLMACTIEKPVFEKVKKK